MQFSWIAFNTLSGLCALVGIPLILLIHFLQKKTNRVLTSTSFLVKRLPLEEVKGSKFSHLRPSWPLLLQIISVAIITILLLDPHTPQIGMVNRVVLLMDSSVSMRPFKKQTIEALRLQIPNLMHSTLPTEWIVSESGGHHRLIYSGASDHKLLSTIEQWQPNHNHHSLLPAIEHLKKFSQSGNAPIIITDQQTSEIAGYDVIGVGHPIENVGFTGLMTNSDHWSVTLRNNSNSPQRRTLTLETDERNRITQIMDLKPHELKIIRDSFSEDKPDSRMVLKLQPDEFSLDDSIPILKPLDKSIKVFILVGNELSTWKARMLALIQPADAVSHPDQADLMIMQASPEEIKTINKSGIFLLEGEQDSFATYRNITAENHLLPADLHFEGIRVSATQTPAPKFEHKPLLHDKDKAVAWLREDPESYQIILGNRIRNEQALTHQSIIVMLHRFVEQYRSSIRRYHVTATETNQVVSFPGKHKYLLQNTDISVSAIAGATSHTGGSGEFLTMPASPGFVDLFLDDQPYATYNNYFSDPREANFLEATDHTNLSTHRQIAKQVKGRRIDWTYPLFALLCLIQLTWYMQTPASSNTLGLNQPNTTGSNRA